jgi:hypothetical protein
MIDSYRFGRIVVDKVAYDRDLIVFPDRVRPDWRRGEGHLLRWLDAAESVVAFNPGIIVIGTGKFGRMRIGTDFSDEIGRRNIALHVESTDRAVKTFNRLVLEGGRAMGAFHLTC